MFRQLFGWENVSPVIYCGLGMLLGQLYCMVLPAKENTFYKRTHSISTFYKANSTAWYFLQKRPTIL